LDQIIDMKHELVQLAGKVDWEWIDEQIAPLYSVNGRPAIETRFMLGLLLLKHIYGLSDEGVCEHWVHDASFQYFRVFPARIPARALRPEPLAQAARRQAGALVSREYTGALRGNDLQRVTVDTTVQPKAITFPTDAKLLHAAIKHTMRLWCLTGACIPRFAIRH
jgi:IS5 family transposase